jgi:hypothetical protein
MGLSATGVRTMQTKEYIARLRVTLDAPSDYKLALVLGIAPNVLQRYTKGGTFDNIMSVRVAKLLDLPPMQVIADMERERAKDEKAMSKWEKFMREFAPQVQAALFVGAIAATESVPSVYIMSTEKKKVSQ